MTHHSLKQPDQSGDVNGMVPGKASPAARGIHAVWTLMRAPYRAVSRRKPKKSRFVVRAQGQGDE